MQAKELYKKLSRDKPSEKLWGLEEQPEVTCPMIDATIADVSSFISKLTEFIILLEENIKFSEENKEERLSFVLQMQDLINSLDNLIGQYKKLPAELEKLRTYLTNIRQQAQDHKDKLWENISYSIEIEKSSFKKISRFAPVNTRKKNEITGEEIHSLINEIIESHSLSWDEFDTQDTELIKVQNLITESLLEVKNSFLSDKPLNEVLNCQYLNEWVDSVLQLSTEEAGDSFISFIENHGYNKA